MKGRICIGMAIVIGLVLPAAHVPTPADQSAWMPPLNLSQNGGRSLYPQVVSDPFSGDVHVLWTDDSSGDWEIFYRRWDSTSRSWTPARDLSNSPWIDHGSAFLVDGRGHGHLVWIRRYAASFGAPADGTDILYRRWDGSSWSEEELIYHNDAYLPEGYGLALVELADKLCLFVSYGQGFTRTCREEDVWSPLEPWNYELGVSISALAADEQGHLHAVGYGENSGAGPWDHYFRDVYYTTFDGLEWSAPFNVSSTDGAAHDASLAMDAEGNVHVLWTDIGSPYSSESDKSALYERVLARGIWSANAEVTAPNPERAVQDVDVVADKDGTLHLAWTEGLLVQGQATGLDVHYARNEGLGWSAEGRVYASAAESLNVCLAIGEEGHVYLVWQEGPSGAEEIYFASDDPRIVGTYGVYLPLIVKGE